MKIVKQFRNNLATSIFLKHFWTQQPYIIKIVGDNLELEGTIIISTIKNECTFVLRIERERFTVRFMSTQTHSSLSKFSSSYGSHLDKIYATAGVNNTKSVI